MKINSLYTLRVVFRLLQEDKGYLPENTHKRLYIYIFIRSERAA